MATSGRSDEDQTVEIKERWSPRRGDRSPHLAHDLASFESSKLFKQNQGSTSSDPNTIVKP